WTDAAMALYAAWIPALGSFDRHRHSQIPVRSRRLWTALAARQELCLARNSVGHVFWRVDDGRGLRAPIVGAYQARSRFSTYAGKHLGMDFFRRRLCRTDRGDSLSRTVGHLPGRNHAGQAAYR